jgi:outer membrane lipoprotein-sorting protein
MATVKHVNEDGSVEIYEGVVLLRKDNYFRFAYRTVNGSNVEFDGWTDYWELSE